MAANIDYLITFALSVLAVYRISYMLVNEDGPADIFGLIRERMGQKSWIGRGLNCVLCISFWLSAIPAIFMPHFFLLDWLAIAGMTLIIHRRLQQR